MADGQAQQLSERFADVQLDESPFGDLLEKEFRVKDAEKGSLIGDAVATLAHAALQNVATISDDVISTIEAMIAELDRRLSKQLDAILHHPDFQQLEGSWRGLHFLCNNTETDETLKIRVLNVTKTELRKELAKNRGAKFDNSIIFKKIYEDEYGTPGGEPYGCLVGDYYFDHTAPDVGLLGDLAQVASAAHAPFIAGAAPKTMDMESWQELPEKRDITQIFQSPEYAPWRSLREREDSMYVGLAMPRVLSRLPYGPETNPVDEFAYVEETGKGDHDKYTWMNAAYAMATNVTRSFKLYGWCTRIRGVESGGMVEGLPVHTFPSDDGGTDMKCPTEIAITDRREAELAKNGFMPLSHWKNTDYAVFVGAQSLNKPKEYEDADATANANLSARLPYLFSTCRFAHYLKCMVRDKIGSFKERADMEKWLNNWISQYVTTDPSASEETKAQYPLAAAEVRVQEVEGNPGYYTSQFFLRPHYQLEGLTASLRLTSRLPSEKGG